MDARKTTRWPVVIDALKAWRQSLPEGQRSLEAAGALLGVSGPQMYRYENGLRRVPPEKVRAISKVTGVDPEVLRPDIFGPPRSIKPKPRRAVLAG